MLPKMNGLQHLLRPLSIVVFHLVLIHYCRGQSQVIGPSQPVVAIVGHDIILPCQVEPEQDAVAMTLEWTRPDLSRKFIHVRRSGTDLVHAKHPSYKERTSLSIEEMKRGNVSLKLTKVKLADAGKYKCYIPKLNAGTLVELVVASDVVSTPVISLSGIDKDSGSAVLQCNSAGWSPEPEVFWLDGEGNLLSAGPPETVRGPDDLYTVSSRVTVEKRHSNSFTCRVTQKKTNQTRETQIQVPEDFFNMESSSSSSTVGLTVGLAVCILIILILLFIVCKEKPYQPVELTTPGMNIVSEIKKLFLTRWKFEEELQKKTAEMEKQLQDEKERAEKEKKELMAIKEELETKLFFETTYKEDAQTEAWSTQIQVDMIEEKMEKFENELEAKTREVNNLTDDVEKLKEEKKDLQNQLENNNKEFDKKLQEEKKKAEKAEGELKNQRAVNEELEKKLFFETAFKEEAQTEAWSLQIEVDRLREERERSVNQVDAKIKEVEGGTSPQ